MYVGKRGGKMWGKALPGTISGSSNYQPAGCWTTLLTFAPRIEQKVDITHFGVVNVRPSLHIQGVFSHWSPGWADDRQQALGRWQKRDGMMDPPTQPQTWHKYSMSTDGGGWICGRGMGRILRVQWGTNELNRVKLLPTQNYRVRGRQDGVWGFALLLPMGSVPSTIAPSGSADHGFYLCAALLDDGDFPPTKVRLKHRVQRHQGSPDFHWVFT